MDRDARKVPVLSRMLLTRSDIAELQAEARLELLQLEDDVPSVPSPMASAQFHRAVIQGAANV